EGRGRGIGRSSTSSSFELGDLAASYAGGRLFLFRYIDNAKDHNGQQVQQRQGFQNRHAVTSYVRRPSRSPPA
ncbi:hypothetical protein, partial [uncultured Oscillibacter sp.]|uniref:hypothetical protein n=1 Tax=uncultured Oscillibacter sp. TaxID=876091 RepID=UPI002630915A